MKSLQRSINWLYHEGVSNVFPLNDKSHTPELILANTLSDTKNIDSVVVLCTDKEGRFRINCSIMDQKTITWLAKRFDSWIDSCVFK